MFLVEEKKIDKNYFEKSLHFEGGGGAKANLEKVYILFFSESYNKITSPSKMEERRKPLFGLTG